MGTLLLFGIGPCALLDPKDKEKPDPRSQDPTRVQETVFSLNLLLHCKASLS